MSMMAAAGNGRIIKESVNTSGEYGGNGLLSPADSEKFILMMQDDSSFLGKMDSEIVNRIEGTISKLGVAPRLLRNYTENKDNITENEVKPVIGNVAYTCKRMTLGTSISEAWIQQNKAKENFEELFMEVIAQQLRIDLLDLGFNGDEAAAGDDAAFLKLNDGFIKQIKAGGNVVDGATIDGGKFSKSVFYALRRAVPSKYRNKNFRWICSDDTYTDLSEYMSDRPTSFGDIALKEGNDIKILGTNFECIPNFPDDVIIFADPNNLKVVYFGEIRHRKTVEGADAIYKDERYYAEHMAVDYVIKEVKATGILINRGALVTA